MKPSEILLGILRLPVDFFAGIMAFYLAYQIRFNTDLIPFISLPLDLGSFPTLENYFIFSAVGVIVLMILMALNNLYSLKSNTKYSRETGKIAIVISAWLMLIIAYFFVIREFPFSRLVLAYTWFLMIVCVCAGRGLIRVIESFLLLKGIGKKNVLFIGATPITEKLALSMKRDLHYHIAGVLDDKMGKIDHIKTLGKLNELAKIVKKYHIEEIIQTTNNPKQSEDATDILDFCRSRQVGYRFVPDLLAVQSSNIEVETFNGLPIITLKPTPLDGWGRVLKRAFDIFASVVGLIILSPILLLVAILIKVDSKGTILFKYLDDGSRVKRVGEQGKLFNFYKFRTMHPKTHNLRYTELAEQNTRKGTPMVKIKNDPRVTKIGNFLRKTSIDELPQLINVLKGQMSIVGPRPHLPEEVANYEKHHKFVLTIKPGITGLAQISGRSDLDFEKEVRLDSYYIEHWSLWMDIKIIFKTFGAVIKGYKE
ncbi:sugar transferase [Candidatus Peregrinibacteria bacterium]|nr:sugar transferase [Candidatus Peregrinibacteria bacterium]